MPSEAAFLRRVLAEPKADGPRLVFADWLDELGDPRGEFIRLQCALAHMRADDPARSELAQRERDLRNAHVRQWTKPFAGKATRCTFRRGFVEEVTMPARNFVEHGEKLLAAAPICAVRLTDVADNIDALATCSALALVADLDITGNELGDQGAERLFRSPHVKSLSNLSMGANGLTDRAVQALGTAGLSLLTYLDLSYNHIRHAGPLAELPALDELDVGHNELAAAALPALLAAKLGKLHLAGNPIGDEGAMQLFDSSAAFTKGSLDLSRCGLGPAAIQSLLAAADHEQLKTLLLNDNAVGDAGLIALAAAGTLPNLRRLGLAGNGITDAGASNLADSPLFLQLERLDLRNNRLRPAGVDLLWNHPRRRPGLRVELADNVPYAPPRDEPADDSPIRVDWNDDLTAG